MKEIGIVFLLLVASVASAATVANQAQFIPDTCPIPQQETCPLYSSDPVGAQNCQARNNNANARYWQCEQELQRAREEERKQQEQEQHDRYCQQYPDANGCK